MTAHAAACTCRDCCLDRAAQLYVDALAARDAMTAEDAARAAGARSPEQIQTLAAQIRADREELRSTA